MKLCMPVQVLYGVNQRLRIEDVDSPLVNVRPVKAVTLVVVTGDRGLCGGYNNFVLKKVRCALAPGQPAATSASWTGTERGGLLQARLGAAVQRMQGASVQDQALRVQPSILQYCMQPNSVVMGEQLSKLEV